MRLLTILCACSLLPALQATAQQLPAGSAASDTRPDTLHQDEGRPAHSAPGSVASLFDSLPRHIKWSAQVMAFGRATNFTKTPGTVNPDNRIAKLDRYDGGLYLRPEVKYENGPLELDVKPRLNINVNGDRGGLFNKDKYDSRLYIQELKAKWQLSKSLYLMGWPLCEIHGHIRFLQPQQPVHPRQPGNA